MPVRCRATWERPEITEALAETLGFLSDDHYAFDFIDHDGGSIRQRILFELGGDEGDAEEILMFSGGLDSFAGAAEALFERGNRVALVSHHSAPFTRRIQAGLVKELRARTSPERLRHFRLEVKMRDGPAVEGTHRTRSFLFAALGLVVARSHGRSRVDFHENGVVSLNLAPLEQFVGGRATRSTHPLALAMISRLFGLLTGEDFKVGNPFLWRTNVIARIRDLGLADLLPHTHSCANVRSAHRMLPHCGRCSQCIDRRFAVLAAGCARDDPAEMYGVDLLSGDRIGPDRELALAYPALPGPAEADWLPWAEPECPPVRRGSRLSWPDLQAGARSGAGMLVEVAWAAARSPGPLRAFYQRLAARRGRYIAAVATAPEAGDDRLTHADQGGRTTSGATDAARAEVQGHRAARRVAYRAQQARRYSREARGATLRALHLAMANAASGISRDENQAERLKGLFYYIRVRRLSGAREVERGAVSVSPENRGRARRTRRRCRSGSSLG